MIAETLVVALVAFVPLRIVIQILTLIFYKDLRKDKRLNTLMIVVLSVLLASEILKAVLIANGAILGSCFTRIQNYGHELWHNSYCSAWYYAYFDLVDFMTICLIVFSVLVGIPTAIITILIRKYRHKKIH